MGKIYFTRHGETFTNTKKLVCGAREIALTENGHAQAIALGNEVKSKIESGELKIDVILYSPLSRAKDTALHISELTGIPAREEALLIERNFGSFEDKSRESAEFKASLRTFAMSYGREAGGESNMRTAQRIYNLLDRLTEETKRTGKTFLLVAHNGLARVVNSYFCDMTNEEFGVFGITNCQLLEYEF
ncbi:MAG: histidine phosphatase family protein [Treponema sp.]|uniref:histidine phosphatase family protein n=1 Tax=Treponema sp. TaxID=166 RepID=UPI0025EB098E|nr:histidine phosphatase family protein [Treponema sp.]MBQ9282035.1 histidine phosphatase family protein [Treponema sp.]